MFHSKQDVDRHVEEIFRKLKTDDECNSKCYHISKNYFKVGDFKSALKYINRFIPSRQNSALAHKLLGEIHEALGQKAKALDAYKTSLEIEGGQQDLVVKVCELLADPDIPLATSRASYWLERAENLFPKHPVVFKLKEHLLKNNLDGKETNAKLENLILSEVTARPNDVTVRIRLLNLYLELSKPQLAYQHAIDIEKHGLFSRDLRWYDCLARVMQAYGTSGGELAHDFHERKMNWLERRAELSLVVVGEETRTLAESSVVLFGLDQAMHAYSNRHGARKDKKRELWAEHMRAQLSFHLATLALGRGKKEPGTWKRTVRTASPLLLQAAQETSEAGCSWEKEAAFRVSQAGHVLLGLAETTPQLLEKILQWCGGKWRERVYTDVFYSKEHQQAMGTSHFVNHPAFATLPLTLPRDVADLARVDELSQTLHPESLHHMVWLGLSYCNATTGQLTPTFKCCTVPNLKLTVDNLSNTGPETLNQLDVDSFLYAAVMCARSAAPNMQGSDRPPRLPVAISTDLCTQTQSEWWSTVYKMCSNQSMNNIAQMRLRLRKGIETVRVVGNHGVHVKLIVMLAKVFQARASHCKNTEEAAALTSRASMYWTAAIPLLERLEKNQVFRETPNRLFDYKGRNLGKNEIKTLHEDGLLFLAVQLLKQNKLEEALEEFSSLKGPYASYHKAMIYKKLASEEVDHSPESITSQNRSQNIVLLTLARAELCITMDRLRSDTDHELYAELHVHLDEIDGQLSRIDLDSNLARNGDAESDESDTRDALGGHNQHLDHLHQTQHSTPRPNRYYLNTSLNHRRTDVRPSPERLEAQLRSLMQNTSTELRSINEGVQALVAEVKLLKMVVLQSATNLETLVDAKQQTSVGSVAAEIKPEELFEFPDEDDYAEDLTHYANAASATAAATPSFQGYHGYPNMRQMTGLQGMLPPLPPNFFNTPKSVVPGMDAMMMSLGYFGQMPMDQALGMPHVSGTVPTMPHVQGSMPTMPSAASMQKAGLLVKPQDNTKPPNVVMTVSDALPAYTASGTPAMSVTIPPQHLRGVRPPQPTHLNQAQAHAFQIAMPPQAQLVNKSPADKELTFSSPLNLTAGSGQSAGSGTEARYVEDEYDPRPDFQPIIPLPDEVQIKTGEEDETKLFESRARLYIFSDKEWKERGTGQVKVLHNEATGKARIVMRREHVLTLCANHFIQPTMKLAPMKLSDCAFGWFAHDFADGEAVLRNFSIRFKTGDEARDFEYAFNMARDLVKEALAVMPVAKESERTEAPITPKNSELKSILGGFAFTKPAAKDEAKEKTDEPKKEDSKSTVGGFTFLKPPVLKPPVMTNKDDKAEEHKKITEEKKVAASPFTGFSFSSVGSSQPSNKPFTFSLPTPSETPIVFGGSDSKLDLSTLAKAAASTEAFKQDSNFKGFEGANSPVFGSWTSKADQKGKPDGAGQREQQMKGRLEDERDEEGHGEAVEFVPTANFSPVIPLPDLVELKTGEEEETELYKGPRCKILRYDSERKEWKERGVGNMKVLLNEATGKVRLLMRREQVLKVCCNQYLDETIVFSPMQNHDRVFVWCAKDFSEGDLKTETLAIRFGKCESAQEFKALIDETQKKMKDGRLGGSQKARLDEIVKPEQSWDKFKPAAGTWACDMCYVNNKDEAAKCVACDTPRPGSAHTDTKPLSEMFKPKPGSWACDVCYVNNMEKEAKCVACETPRPGSAHTDAKSPRDSGSGMAASKPQGITLDPSLASAFKFGVPPGHASSTSPSNAASVFGEMANKSGVTAPHTFVFGLQPRADSSAGDNKQAAVPFSFSAIKSNIPGGDFKIGSPGKFEFSFSGVKTVTAKSPKSPGAPSASGEDSDGEPEEDYGDKLTFEPVIPLPEKVPLHTGEEDELVRYVHRAKLFRYVGGEWKERGLGDVKVLEHKTTHKIRLLMRREQILKICLNHYVNPDMEFLPKDEKTWLWSAADFSEGTIQRDKFAIRFKTSDIAADFKKAVEEAQAVLPSSPAATGSPGTAETPKAAAPATVVRNLFGGFKSEDKDEVTVVYATEVTPQQREAALKLQLPPNFYSYLRSPGCPGCPGCDSDSEIDSSVKIKITSATPPAIPTSSDAKHTFSFAKPIFQSSSQSIFRAPDSTSHSKPGVGSTPQADSSGPIFGTVTPRADSSSASIFGGSLTNSSQAVGSTDSTVIFGSGFNIKHTSSAVTESNKKLTFDIPTVKSESVFDAAESIFGTSNANSGDSAPVFDSVDVNKSDNSKLAYSNLEGTPAAVSKTATPIFGALNIQLSATSTTPKLIFGGASTTEATSTTPTSDNAQGTGPFFNAIPNLTFTNLAKQPETQFGGVQSFTWGAEVKPVFGGPRALSQQSPKKGSAKKKEESESEDGEEEGQEAEHDPQFAPVVALPDVVEVLTGEEAEEKVFCERSKLFRYDNKAKEWKERGVGEMKILHHPEQQTFRLLLRRDQVHKVVCNMLVTSTMNMLPSGEKAWVWAGMNHTQDEVKGDVSNIEKLAVRFKSEELAAAFKKRFDECQARLRSDEEGDEGGASYDDKDYDKEDEEYGDEEDDDCRELVMEKVVSAYVLSPNCEDFVKLGDDSRLEVYKLNGFLFCLEIKETSTGRLLSKSLFDSETEAMYRMSPRDCLWTPQELLMNEYRTVLIHAATPADANDIVAFLGECKPPHEMQKVVDAVAACTTKK